MTVRQVSSLPLEVLDDNLAFISVAREGISGQVVYETVKLLGGYKTLVADLVGTTPGNLHRIYKKTVLGKAQSEAILDLLRLFACTETIFDSDDIVREWLRCEIPALSGLRPADLLDTFQGRAMVRDVLGKIKYGDFS